MAKADIGLWGLAVIGQNLVLNMESKGFTIAVFNRTDRGTAARTRALCISVAGDGGKFPSDGKAALRSVRETHETLRAEVGKNAGLDQGFPRLAVGFF